MIPGMKDEMGSGEMKGDVKAADISAKNKASTEKSVGGKAPMATEELEASRLSALADAVNAAIETAGNGEIPVSVMAPAGPADQVPADLFTALVALSGLISQLGPAGRPYQFNPMKTVSTNADIVELTDLLMRLVEDPKALTAMRSGAPKKGKEPGAEPEEAPEATEEDEFDSLA